MNGPLNFEKWLATRRTSNPCLRSPSRNPYADEFARELNWNLKVVERWLVGQMQSDEMERAMQFFNERFPGEFEADSGAMVYRGQRTPEFDGSPRSYSYSAQVAEQFAQDSIMGLTWPQMKRMFKGETTAFIVERRVCDRCADQDAFRYSLDMAKLLRAYESHKFASEREVVILNTRPKSPAKVLEVS
jgi:hypothetical protein